MDMPKRRREVPGYRAFAAIVFMCVVAVVAWSDRTSGNAVVGPVGVMIWALTLIGHFGVGPVRRMWDALRR
jgi:hypothetical protein